MIEISPKFTQKKKKHKCIFFQGFTLTETLLHGCYSRFLNCTNSTKLRNAPHTDESI